MAKPIIRNLAVVAAILGIILLGTGPGRTADESAGANVKSFTLVSVMVDDAKIWLPSSIMVEKGDHVSTRQAGR